MLAGSTIRGGVERTMVFRLQDLLECAVERCKLTDLARVVAVVGDVAREALRHADWLDVPLEAGKLLGVDSNRAGLADTHQVAAVAEVDAIHSTHQIPLHDLCVEDDRGGLPTIRGALAANERRQGLRVAPVLTDDHR